MSSNRFRRVRVGLAAALTCLGLPLATPPASSAADVSGVTQRVFELGRNLEQLCTLKAGQTPNVDERKDTIDWSSPDDFGGYSDRFLVHALGTISVPEDGTYTFRLTSDDGSKLFIDDEVVIDHDGLHEATPKDGEVELTAGAHDLRVEYFEATNDQQLTLSWRPPGAEGFTVVPKDVLSTDDPTRVTAPGIKQCEGDDDSPGDGLPVGDVHPDYDLTDLRPEGFKPDVSGMDWFPDGRLAVLTWGKDQESRSGKLFILRNVTGKTTPDNVKVRKVADGLREPQGVAIVKGKIYVAQKHELSQLVDGDGDGTYEKTKTVAKLPTSGNFHEFAFGLLYRKGYFYLSLSVALEKSGSSVDPQPAKNRGTSVRINAKTGKIDYVAGGLRTPNGMGWGPDGSVLVTDNQGDWLPANKLVRIERGAFYNHYTNPAGPFDHKPVTKPVLWMPQNEIANSPSTPVVLEKGPFAGQLAIGDVTYGGLQRAYLEKVGGEYQGAVFRMTQGLEAGVNEVSVGPDGAVYIGGIGWEGNWGQPNKLRFGLQKLDTNGKDVMDIKKMELTPRGFDLTYTKPVSEETLQDLVSAYQVEQWRYSPTDTYGGPKIDEESLPVRKAKVSKNGKRVSLTIDGLKPGRVVHVRSPRPFTSEDGQKLWSTEAWYTLNKLPGYTDPAKRKGLYESEEAQLSGGATVATDHTSYSGSGFVGGYGTKGASTKHRITTRKSGNQTVRIRYSNGPHPSEGPKTLGLFVNGTFVKQVTFPSTGDWQSWKYVKSRLKLRKGSNIIELRNRKADTGHVNLDYVKVGARADICRATRPSKGYTSLFNGTLTSLGDWRMAGPGAFARRHDCTLRTVGGMGLLWHQGELENYSLKADWKLSGDDNAGVFVGFPDPGDDPWVAVDRGHEIQIDATDDDNKTTGAVYGFQGADLEARDEALNPPGKWNSYRLRVEGDRIRVYLNGTLINDYTNTDDNRMVPPTFVGLQNHGEDDTAYFRNIEIKKLKGGR